MGTIKNHQIYFKIFILICILGWLGFHFAQKIDLTTADLGRHLKSGEIILTNLTHPQQIQSLLNTNFYSYTYPDYPVVNHHWGAGVIFFLVRKIIGFSGLSLFYVGLNLITFAIFFLLGWKKGGFKITLFLSLLLVPLLTARTEVRPEIFSYFLSAVFLWLLLSYKDGTISYRQLFILPLLMVLWVNVHIYFFFGLFLIGVFLFEELLLLSKMKFQRIFKLGVVFVLTAGASFCNPFGLKAVIYPFNIFKNYGYRVLENQSVWFLQRLGFVKNLNLALFAVICVMLILSFVLLLILNRRKFSISFALIGVAVGIMGWLAIRNFTLFGLFALPIIAYNLKEALAPKINLESWAVKFGVLFLSLVILIFYLVNNYQILLSRYYNFGFGLARQNDLSVAFFERNNIQGPILNNYDIGGYLIYYLYPQERVFVDNRPEAYPASFFDEIYVPLQENEEKWQQIEKQYNFNAVLFSYRDLTPWGQNFLIERVQDPLWAPVFADPYAIIFLRRNVLNQSIINQYEIPKEYFRIVKQ